MRLLPLFKFGSRAKSTGIGIALCTMFIVASFSIAAGLESSMDKLSATFESDYSLITKIGTAGMAYFDERDLSSLSADVALGSAATVEILPYEEFVTVFSVTDSDGVLPAPLGQVNDTVLKSKLDYVLGDITLVGAESLDLSLSGSYSSSFFPSDWLLTSQNVMWVLTNESGLYNYAVAVSLDGDEIQTLESNGFSVQKMKGIIDFLESGVKEVRSDMSWVLLPSSFVIAVLAYSFSSAEISDRRHEIGVIKSLGAGRARVLSYLIGHALLVSVWGGILGVAFGIVLSYAISTSASSVFTSVFVMGVDEALIAVAFLVTAAAGVLGSLLPAVRMTLTSPVDDLKEVVR